MITPRNRRYRNKSIKRKHNELDELRRELLLLRSKVENIERNKHGGTATPVTDATAAPTVTDATDTPAVTDTPVTATPVTDTPVTAAPVTAAPTVTAAPADAVNVPSEFDLVNMNTVKQKQSSFVEDTINSMIKRTSITMQQEPILIQGPIVIEKMAFEMIKIFNNYFNAFTNPEFQAQVFKLTDPSVLANVMDPLVERLPGYINKLIESKFLYWIHHPETNQDLQHLLIQLFQRIMPQESKVIKGGFSQDDCF